MTPEEIDTLVAYWGDRFEGVKLALHAAESPDDLARAQRACDRFRRDLKWAHPRAYAHLVDVLRA